MEVLGLLDVLESKILDGTKIPFSKRVIIDEEDILSIIDKVRLVIQGGGGFAKVAISAVANEEQGVTISAAQAKSATMVRENPQIRTQDDAKSVEVLQQAYQMAKEIREGADRYADEVLANIEATTTRILRSIKAGRERLGQKNEEE
ncbi:MAG: hypothetical protein KKA31_03410 [Candidatus Margulisbacteria bacterium]|nr:hypothetical protein [Candidatus Margulisiibacteriota bacterium]